MNAIVVVDSRWAIGCEGRLLFSLPTDMKRFRSLTLNGTVILAARPWTPSLAAGPCPSGGTSSSPAMWTLTGRAARSPAARRPPWSWRQTPRRTNCGSSAAAASTPPCCPGASGCTSPGWTPPRRTPTPFSPTWISCRGGRSKPPASRWRKTG
ncbi:MAG: dihydrofolate reductase [Oscillospiraceae bacterium]|nr:dihydrofolate reductase [Oscillospiraceae bacterium]